MEKKYMNFTSPECVKMIKLEKAKEITRLMKKMLNHCKDTTTKVTWSRKNIDYLDQQTNNILLYGFDPSIRKMFLRIPDFRFVSAKRYADNTCLRYRTGHNYQVHYEFEFSVANILMKMNVHAFYHNQKSDESDAFVHMIQLKITPIDPVTHEQLDYPFRSIYQTGDLGCIMADEFMKKINFISEE